MSKNHLQHQQIVEHLLNQATSLMTPEELQMFREELMSLSLQQIIEEFLPQWYDDLWLRKPVGMREFIQSPDYLNKGGEIYERIIDDLEELFEGGYEEAIIEGGIGWGKSVFTSLALTRMVYEVSCLKNPQIAYGIMSGSPIRFVNIATTFKLAKDVVFGYVKDFVNDSPYFDEHYKLDKDLTKELTFPGKVSIFPASSNQSGALGQNVFGAVIDEANFFHKVEKSAYAVSNEEIYDPAKVLHNMLSRRIESRFSRQGKTPGILLTASSSMYPDDFTAWRWKEAQKNGETDRVFYRKYAQWETKPANFYGPERFLVSIGNSIKRPRIILEENDDNYDSDLDDIKTLKEENITIIEVPENFKRQFKKDIDMAVRDIAGFATLATHPFFRDLTPFEKSVERGNQRGLKHPFTKISTNLEDGVVWIRNNLDTSKKYNHHFAHIDLSLTGDSTGITVVRLDGRQPKATETLKGDEFSEQYTLENSYEWVPQATLVFSLKIIPPMNGQIKIDKVRHLLVDMMNWGFVFSGITMDQFQSVSTLQYFQNIGINAYLQSVDRTMAPYFTLREYLTEDRLDMYNMPVIRDEAAFVEIDTLKKKIDHPPGKTKDVLDSLAAAVFCLDKFHKDNPGILVKGDSEYAGNTLSIGYDDLDEFNDFAGWVNTD